MKTRVTEKLGIEYPILQGGMAWVAEYHLAAAVSNAGGGGIIATGGRDGAWVREQIEQAKALTSKPFGVNLGLVANNPKDLDDLITAICEGKPAFVTVGAGNPIPFLERFHKAGIQVIGIIPSLRLAKRVEAAGIDMIVLEGTESGGRIGHLSTLAHLTNIIPEVKLPVLAAGGIADGRGLAAAMIMGAEGIQMGTRFLVSEECVVHPQYKEEIIKATDEQSVTTGLSRNLGMRGLRSAFTEKYHQMEITGISDDELSRFATGASRAVAERGLGPDGMNGMVQCGQGIVPIKKIKSVKRIIEDTVSEAEALLSNAPKLVK